MPRSSGNYTLPSGNPVVSGTVISTTWANNTLNDVATELTNSIPRDGTAPPSANLPMGNFKITGIGAATLTTDVPQYQQIQSGASLYLTAVSGTNTITGTLSSPTLAAYAAGNTFRFTAAGTNTGATTLNINALGAKAITKNGTTALVSGDIPSGAFVEVGYDGTQFQLINVSSASFQPPFIDSTALVKGSGDATKLLRLEADGITTATTRVWTAQDKDITVAGLADIRQLQPITASVAANALTITLNPTSLDFRSSTLTSGTVTTVSNAAAISLVVSSGSTLGTTNAVQSRLIVIAINNAGTMELAVVNPSNGLDLTEVGLISTTAEGGGGAADSANVIYSTTARSNVAYRVVGYVESTQATAGTWATAPSTIQGAGGQSAISTALNAQGAAPIFACRAWVNFNGSGVVAIRGSGNVTSITDNGTGDYTVNLTTAMTDVNYSVSGTVQRAAADTNLYTGLFFGAAIQQAVGSFRVQVRIGSTGALEDPIVACYTVHR